MDINEMYSEHYQHSVMLAQRTIIEMLKLCDITKLTTLSPHSQRTILDSMVSRQNLDYDILKILVNENNVNELYDTIDDYIEVYNQDRDALDPFLPGSLLLEIAINQERSDVVDLLLSKGAKVNATREFIDDSGDIYYTHLSDAVRRKNMNIVTTLLYAGADPRIYTFEATPISIAIENGNYEYIDILVAHGADLNHLVKTHDNKIVNPIIFELIKSDKASYDLCLRLIKNGLILGLDKEYPHILNVLGNPIMNMDEKFHWVYLLLSYCYDPNAKGNSFFYDIPLRMAKKFSMTNIQKLLELYGAHD